MVDYCENAEECRRVKLLHYLGEQFTKEQCNKTCDVCCNPCSVEQRDMTSYAKSLLELMKRMGGRHTMLQLINVWRGSQAKAILTAGYNRLSEHGAGKQLTKFDAERLAQQLVRDKYLQEEIVFNKFRGTSITYVRLGHTNLKTPYFMSFRQKLAPIGIAKPVTSPKKQKLTNLLLKELEKVQMYFVKDGIDSQICRQLMKLMCIELPTTPQDLFSDQFTNICPRNLIQRYARKFTETINKFLEEHPEIKTFAPGNVQTLDFHFSPNSAAKNTITNSFPKSKPQPFQKTNRTTNKSYSSNSTNATTNTFTYSTTGARRRGSPATSSQSRSYSSNSSNGYPSRSASSSNSTTRTSRQYSTRGTFNKSSTIKNRPSSIRAVKPKLASKNFSSVLSKGSYKK